jgi:predicted amino acid-binding ACT domain protein
MFCYLINLPPENITKGKLKNQVQYVLSDSNTNINNRVIQTFIQASFTLYIGVVIVETKENYKFVSTSLFPCYFNNAPSLQKQIEIKLTKLKHT